MSARPPLLSRVSHLGPGEGCSPYPPRPWSSRPSGSCVSQARAAGCRGSSLAAPAEKTPACGASVTSKLELLPSIGTSWHEATSSAASGLSCRTVLASETDPAEKSGGAPGRSMDWRSGWTGIKQRGYNRRSNVPSRDAHRLMLEPLTMFCSMAEGNEDCSWNSGCSSADPEVGIILDYLGGPRVIEGSL